MESRTISRVGIGSLVRVSALVYGILAFIFGLFIMLFSLAGFGDRSGVEGALFGVAAPIILPIVYAIFGAIGAAIMGAFYNLVAGWVGGIEVVLQAEDRPAQSF